MQPSWDTTTSPNSKHTFPIAEEESVSKKPINGSSHSDPTLVNGSLNEVEKLGTEMAELALDGVQKKKKASRAHLSLSIIRNLSDEDEASTASTQSSSSDSRSARSDLSIVDRIIQEQNGKSALWAHLALANEFVISSKELFTSVYERISSSSEQAAVLLRFCLFWLEENKETVQVAKVCKMLQKIIQLAATHSSNEVKMLTTQLETLLNASLATPGEKQQVIEKTDGKTKQKPTIGYLVDMVLQNNLEIRYLEAIANDLLIVQYEQYKKMTPHDFISTKWSENSSRMTRYMQFLNSISEMAKEQIRYFDNPKEQLKVVRFFLDIADECLRNNDYATAYQLSIGIKQCIQKGNEQLKKFEKIFSKGVLERYKKHQKDGEAYIPHIKQFIEGISDVKFFDSQLDGLEPVYHIATDFCSSQKNWRASMFSSPSTNIRASLTIATPTQKNGNF